MTSPFDPLTGDHTIDANTAWRAVDPDRKARVAALRGEAAWQAGYAERLYDERLLRDSGAAAHPMTTDPLREAADLAREVLATAEGMNYHGVIGGAFRLTQLLNRAALAATAPTDEVGRPCASCGHAGSQHTSYDCGAICACRGYVLPDAFTAPPREDERGWTLIRRYPDGSEQTWPIAVPPGFSALHAALRDDRDEDQR
jgi:hypothetical protein